MLWWTVHHREWNRIRNLHQSLHHDILTSNYSLSLSSLFIELYSTPNCYRLLLSIFRFSLFLVSVLSYFVLVWFFPFILNREQLWQSKAIPFHIYNVFFNLESWGGSWQKEWDRKYKAEMRSLCTVSRLCCSDRVQSTEGAWGRASALLHRKEKSWCGLIPYRCTLLNIFQVHPMGMRCWCRPKTGYTLTGLGLFRDPTRGGEWGSMAWGEQLPPPLEFQEA